MPSSKRKTRNRYATVFVTAQNDAEPPAMALLFHNHEPAEQIFRQLLVDVGRDAAVAAMLEAIDPQEDGRGPVDFKKHVAGVVLRRAIARAASRA